VTPGTQPLLTETVNGRTGVIRLRGHLTVQGADLVRGTVEGLRRSGHASVLLDLHDLSQADPLARELLGAVQEELAADGSALRIVERG
jgi:anti-anti-sigma regulatory factor